MKPYVICHMCTTIDGKILVDRWQGLPRSRTISSLFEKTADRLGIGAWLVGTTTMSEFSGKPMALPRGARVPREDFVADPKAKRFAIGADAKGRLRFQEGAVDGDHTVVLVTEKVSTGYLAHLRDAGVSYLFCGKNELELPLALGKLRSVLGIKKLLLEGGGHFNGALLHAGLIDEVSQVIVPIVDGGGREVTGVFEPSGDAPHRAAASLRVTGHTTVEGGAHWFRYKVLHARAK